MASRGGSYGGDAANGSPPTPWSGGSTIHPRRRHGTASGRWTVTVPRGGDPETLPAAEPPGVHVASEMDPNPTSIRTREPRDRNAVSTTPAPPCIETAVRRVSKRRVRYPLQHGKPTSLSTPYRVRTSGGRRSTVEAASHRPPEFPVRRAGWTDEKHSKTGVSGRLSHQFDRETGDDQRPRIASIRVRCHLRGHGNS